MPEVAFVAVGAPWRNQLAHRRARQELDVRAVHGLDHFVRDADIRDYDVAGAHLRRRQHQRKFRRRQRDGERGVDGRADRIRRVGRQAGGQVDRHHRDVGRVHVGNDRLDQSRHRPLQPGTENRIDDQRAVAHFGKVQLPRLAVGDLHDRDAKTPEDLQVDARIAAHVRDAADQEHGHVRAPLHERACDDEPVAAVVAPAAEHRDLAVEQVGVHRLHRGDCLAAGVLHEDERRNTDLFNRAAIGVAHLGGVQDTHQAFSGRRSLLTSWQRVLTKARRNTTITKHSAQDGLRVSSYTSRLRDGPSGP